MYLEDLSYCTSASSDDTIECHYCEYDALTTYGKKQLPLCRYHSAALGYCEKCEELFLKDCECEKSKKNTEEYLQILKVYFYKAFRKRNAAEESEQKEEFKIWNSICMDIQENAVYTIMSNRFGLELEEWMRQPL